MFLSTVKNPSGCACECCKSQTSVLSGTTANERASPRMGRGRTQRTRFSWCGRGVIGGLLSGKQRWGRRLNGGGRLRWGKNRGRRRAGARPRRAGTGRPLYSPFHLLLVPLLPNGDPAFPPPLIAGQIAHGQHGVHMAGLPAHPRLFHATLHHQDVGTLHRATANGIAL